MTPKISLIGAGSGAFSLAMIRDLCLTKNLEGATVCMMDVDPGRLEGAYAVCSRYAQELGFSLQIEKTLDPHHALRDADFVINTALAAGHHRLRDGWEIAKKYHYNWGGSFHVMYDEAFWINFYQLRMMESYIQLGLELCPQAYHLMVANPVLAGTTHLYRKFPQAKLVGLCHGFNHIYHIANFLGCTDRSKLTFEIPGVNHFVWLTKAYYEGQNLFPLVDRWIKEKSAEYWASGKTGPLSPKTVSLYQRFGAIPIGDTSGWSGACWPWWYHSDEQVERSWKEHPIDGWNSYFDFVKKNTDDFTLIANDPSIKVTEFFPPTHSGESMVPIIEAITCNIERIVIGNIQNDAGYVPGIPGDFEVEIPILVSSRGMRGIHTKGIPPVLLAHTLRERVVPVNIELEAYNTGNKDLLVQLVMLDPWTRSEAQARGLVEEILSLPYHEEMRAHYQ